MNSDEVEFLAENALVEIIPTFNDDALYLITGTVGPFEAGLPLKVPLWLALYLKQRHKCRISLPEWLKVEHLEELLKEEQNGNVFTAIPQHFHEMGHLLIGACSQELEEGDRIKTLIKDIQDVRTAKLRNGVDVLVKSGGVSAKVNSLTQMEITRHRPSLLASLNFLKLLKTKIPST